MNKEELVNYINECITEECGIEVFLGLKNKELRKANFLADTQQDIKRMFISELQDKIIGTDSSVINFSEADERRNTIYQYDLELTEDMQIFNSVSNGEHIIPIFSFEDDGINNIAYFLIVIGTVEHQIVIYKKIAPVNIYKKNSGLFVRKIDNEFAKIEEDFLRIVPGIDLFMLNGALYIMNLAIIEKNFDIHNVIITSAQNQIDIIQQSDLVTNIDSLRDELSDISFARKLSRISEHSPVLGHIDNQHIVTFTRNHPILRNVIKFSEDGTKIKLTTKKSKRFFLKLLNDDYLTSNLTSIYYDSLAKDPIQ